MRMPELKVVEIPIGEFVPYENNAKKHTREQLDAVENSIKEFGFRNPVIVWENEDGQPEIVAGHCRVTAAKNLGMETVPAIYCNDLTDAQRRALTLADNQTTMMTGWDFGTLSCELDSLAGEFDMSGFGFDMDGSIDWEGVGELTEESYEEPGHDILRCPICGGTDRKEHFIKVSGEAE